jgi:hypothetical protein
MGPNGAARGAARSGASKTYEPKTSEVMETFIVSILK